MSVILNALRNQKQSAEQKQGFFWSKSIKPSRFSFPIFAFVFGLTMFIGVSLAGAIYWVRSSIPAQKVVPEVITAPVVVRNYESEAQQAFEREDYLVSIDLFKQALEKSPQNWVLLNNLALALSKTGKFSEAESYFFKAISANVNCASCYNNLGDLEMKQGFFNEAELYYQKAMKTDPDYADPYFNLGVLQEKNGDLEAATESYQGFLEHLKDKESPLYKKVMKRLYEIQTELY